MKKSNLVVGIIFNLIALGLAALGIFAPVAESLGGLLCGFAGGMAGPGIAMLWKYFYWTRPSREGEYESRLAQEKIEMGDERSVMLRDKSGRMAYLTTMGVLFIAMLTLSLLNASGVMEVESYVILLLSGLLLLHFISGSLWYKYLDKRL